MISVSEAKNIVTQCIKPLAHVELDLISAVGHVLAQDVYATIDIPAFEQSAMDGYAIRFADKNKELIVRGTIAAGAAQQTKINDGEASRIFTGAPLPTGADTIIIQEKVILNGGKITINDAQLQEGAYVRHKGAEVKAGSLAISKDTFLSAPAIGFLAGIGVAKVLAYPMPSVSIIVTGNELQQPGLDLKPGQVYETNSYSLTAALQQAGITQIKIAYAEDDLSVLQKVLEQSLSSSDMVLLTGGVSVGDYDFVVQAASACDVTQQFHKVKQRPGKPLYFGMKGKQPVFGLPGNPASVLSCFYNYVWPALQLLSGKKGSTQKNTAILNKDHNKGAGLTHFLKGFYEQGKVIPLSAQESFRLSSFAQANCLICMEEEREHYKAGETVEIILLPL